MRKARMATVLLTAVLAAVLLGGCGRSFDASGYVKALLDNSYKGDSAEFVAQKVGTQEQAEELYKQGIDTEMKSLTSQADVSDELEGEFREVLQEIFKNVKYTVGEATRKDDTFEVEVKYQKMNIFTEAMKNFETTSQAYVNEMAEKAEQAENEADSSSQEETDAGQASSPEGDAQGDAGSLSQEEMMEEIFRLLKDALKDAMGKITYADEASTTVRVELKNNLWAPNEEDVQNLEKLLFDMEVLESIQ